MTFKMEVFHVTVLLAIFLAATSGQDDYKNNACDTFLEEERLANLHSQVHELQSNIGGDRNETYTFYVGVCTYPAQGIINPDNLELGSDCMVVQEQKPRTGTAKYHCLGTKEDAQATKTIELGWLELSYGHGDPYSSHCKGAERQSRIFFVCDIFAGQGQPQFVEENRDDLICFYLFVWPTTAVCDNSINPGWIIIIILIVLVALWGVAMLIGILVKRFAMGAKGWEQIPLLSWYKLFGELEAEGCDLVCRCKCPQREIPMSTIGKQTTLPTKLDESESETEDEKQDEDLIPM